LECIVSYIHLVRSKNQTDADIVFAPNQIERVGQRVDVRSALVRGKAAISDREVTRHLERRHATAFTVFGRLIQAGGVAGDGVALRPQISSGNTQSRGFATAGAIRKNVIENPAVAGGELVDKV